MGLADAFNEHREDLYKRQEEAAERTDDRQFGTILLLEKMKELGIDNWKPDKEKEHIIDIIPFFAGSQHPTDPPGKLSFLVDLYVYRGIGVGNEHFVANSRVYKIPDPISDYKKAAGRLPKKEFNALKPTRYCFYLVWVHDTTEEEAKGIQIYSEAHFFFQKHLDKISRIPAGGGYIRYTDPGAEGQRIVWSIVKSGQFERSDGSKGDSLSYEGHRFFPRQGPLPDHILQPVFDKKIQLDELIKTKPTYEEVYEAFYTRPYKKEEADAIALGKAPKDLSTSFSSTSDEDPCPKGHDFGKDLDKFEECKGCARWDSCYDENKRLGLGGEKPKETEPEKQITDYPEAGTFCSQCGKPQYLTPSGAVCENDHGGAEEKQTPDPVTEPEPVETPEPEQAEQEKENPPAKKRKILIKKKQ